MSSNERVSLDPLERFACFKVESMARFYQARDALAESADASLACGRIEPLLRLQGLLTAAYWVARVNSLSTCDFTSFAVLWRRRLHALLQLDRDVPPEADPPKRNVHGTISDAIHSGKVTFQTPDTSHDGLLWALVAALAVWPHALFRHGVASRLISETLIPTESLSVETFHDEIDVVSAAVVTAQGHVASRAGTTGIVSTVERLIETFRNQVHVCTVPPDTELYRLGEIDQVLQSRFPAHAGKSVVLHSRELWRDIRHGLKETPDVAKRAPLTSALIKALPADTFTSTGAPVEGSPW
ncbi:MAG: hypothetical protein JXA57_11465 [Armatimonadetes bacterium]|nr:hypothetical protein [Armatimonadota bacterium]